MKKDSGKSNFIYLYFWKAWYVCLLYMWTVSNADEVVAVSEKGLFEL